MFCSKTVHQKSCFLMCRLRKTSIFTRAGLAWAPNLLDFFNLFWLRQFQKLDFSKLSQQKQCPEGFRLSKLPWGTLGGHLASASRGPAPVTRGPATAFLRSKLCRLAGREPACPPAARVRWLAGDPRRRPKRRMRCHQRCKAMTQM